MQMSNQGIPQDVTAKYVRFHADGIDVAILRRTLADTGRVMSRFPDVTCFVDSRGLHFRWRGGKGHLRYHPQLVAPRDRELVLLVPLVRQVDPVATVTAVAATPPPRAPSPYPMLLADILVELGFA